jgi:hypothetical protein
MNLTEFKNAIAKALGLGEDATQDAVHAAFSEKFAALQQENEEAKTKLAKFKEEHKITEITDEDYKKAALDGFKLTGATTLFVAKDLVTFREEAYCKPNSKGFYFKADKVGNDAKLTKIEN